MTNLFLGVKSNAQESAKFDFKEKVDSFVKKYSADFSINNDWYSKSFLESTIEYNSNYNGIWKRGLTFKKMVTDSNINQTSELRIRVFFYQFETEKECVAVQDSLYDLLLNPKSAISKTYSVLLCDKEIVGCFLSHGKGDLWIKFKEQLLNTFGISRCPLIQTH
ncbi:MAG: hypothetical protein ABIT08_13380 [Bacteroidia bacterium]